MILLHHPETGNLVAILVNTWIKNGRNLSCLANKRVAQRGGATLCYPLPTRVAWPGAKPAFPGASLSQISPARCRHIFSTQLQSSPCSPRCLVLGSPPASHSFR